MKKQLLTLTLGVAILGTAIAQDTLAADKFSSSHKPQDPSTATAEDYTAYRQDVKSYVKNINKKMGELMKQKREAMHEYNQSVREYNSHPSHTKKLPYYGPNRMMPNGNGYGPGNMMGSYGPGMMVFGPGPVILDDNNNEEKYAPPYGPNFRPGDCCYDKDKRYIDQDQDRDQEDDNRITYNSPRYQNR